MDNVPNASTTGYDKIGTFLVVLEVRSLNSVLAATLPAASSSPWWVSVFVA